MTQQHNFIFSEENDKRAKQIIARYPEGKQASAVIALLDIAQRQAEGWLPIHVIEYVADYLEMPYMRVYEVASFYTMFNLKPVGKFHIQVCGTTPCYLRGAGEIINACKKHLNLSKSNTSTDNLFTVSEVECLGACVNAPIVQINDDYYEDLTPEATIELLEKLKAGTTPNIGSQIGRNSSAPSDKSIGAK